MAENDLTYPLVEFHGLLDKLTINHEIFSTPKFGEKSLLEDLQANILKHHRRTFACHIFFKFKQDKLLNALSWFKELKLTSAFKQLEQRRKDKWEDSIRCFYLSASGYSFLNVLHFAPKSCPSFYKGLRDEVVASFDNQKGEPFYSGNRSVNFDGMLLIAADELKGLKEEVSTAIDEMNAFATTKTQYGFLKKSMVNGKRHLTEWFGFKDGISEPKYFPAAKEIIKESGIARLRSLITKDRGGEYELSAGSYLVFLKMRQDYEAFKALRDEIKEGIKKPKDKMNSYREELAEAYIVGRFTDGTPVTLKDEEANEDVPNNDFNYKELLKANNSDFLKNDDLGVRCPFHAHIRKSNERGSLNTYEETKVHRRGVLYADDSNLEYAQEKARTEYLKEGKEVGMLFMSFQSHIEKQFEYTVKSKLHLEKVLPNGNKTGKDMLTAKAGEEYCIPQNWNGAASNENLFSVKKDQSLTQLLGGAYFFAPSLSFFKTIIKENIDLISENEVIGNPVSLPANELLEHPRLKKGVVNMKTGVLHVGKSINRKISIERHPHKMKNLLD